MRHKTAALLTSLLLLFAGPVLMDDADADQDQSLSLAIAVELEFLTLAPEALPFGADTSSLLQFYGERANVPLWAGDDRSFARAAPLVERLVNAGVEGLDARDYAAAVQAWQERDERPDVPAVARLEVALSAALIRYATDLAFGRIDPDTVSEQLFDIPRRPDPVNLLWDADAVADVGVWLDGLAPAWPQYRALRRALAALRAMEPEPDLAALPEGDSLKPGMDDPRVAILRARLVALGELDADNPDSTLFDADLEAAVIRFQQRHGLDDDGVVGRRTRAALNLTLAERIAQVELNMERLRWLRDDLGDRFIWINIAGFGLVLVEDGREVMEMDVIVGRDYRSTPVFSGLMTYLELNPYWNVPHKLAVEDILPKVQADPAYLEDHDYEVFAGWQSDVPLDPGTIDWSSLDRSSFSYRLRQGPGPENALGRVKFMLPNEHAVYLHDTPNRGLFFRAERAFSSGCVRLSDPTALALYLLADADGWNLERLEEVWTEGTMTRVSLPRPIPVYFSYMTAWVDKGGELQFRNDIYGRDAALREALEDS